ncbi:MAG: lipoprotein-releasing ABC transporter ATP-binding protein LolD [Gammaproteobacteria bacterium]|nr:lipoprotein-releasing ABC transporter ATP-binding protein LolD [Gammaproteobacteria bacterium]
MSVSGPESVVLCREVSKTFTEGGLSVEVLRDVNLRVDRGDQMAIVGASGSGKSTLLHILGGLAEPTTGEVLVDNRDISRLSQKQRGVLRNRSLGFVYQFHHLLPEFSALENVAMPLWIRRTDGRTALSAARDLLDRVGLAHRLTHKPAELSGGERQRVAIARALVSRPKCLIADEPTGNLDSGSAEAIHELLVALNRENRTSLIVATHNIGLAEKMERIVRIENGALRPVAP